MEEEDRSRWGPQSPHKHQPPMMPTHICGCSSPFHVTQEQSRAKGPKVPHHFLGDLLVLFKLAQTKSRLSQEKGKDMHRTRLLYKLLAFCYDFALQQAAKPCFFMVVSQRGPCFLHQDPKA